MRLFKYFSVFKSASSKSVHFVDGDFIPSTGDHFYAADDTTEYEVSAEQINAVRVTLVHFILVSNSLLYDEFNRIIRKTTSDQLEQTDAENNKLNDRSEGNDINCLSILSKVKDIKKNRLICFWSYLHYCQNNPVFGINCKHLHSLKKVDGVYDALLGFKYDINRANCEGLNLEFMFSICLGNNNPTLADLLEIEEFKIKNYHPPMRPDSIKNPNARQQKIKHFAFLNLPLFIATTASKNKSSKKQFVSLTIYMKHALARIMGEDDDPIKEPIARTIAYACYLYDIKWRYAYSEKKTLPFANGEPLQHLICNSKKFEYDLDCFMCAIPWKSNIKPLDTKYNHDMNEKTIAHRWIRDKYFYHDDPRFLRFLFFYCVSLNKTTKNEILNGCREEIKNKISEIVEEDKQISETKKEERANKEEEENE